MPFDGSGNFSPSAAPAFPAVGGAVISPTYYNSVINDIATGLSTCLTRDGQGKPSAAIDWNAKNLTNVATFGCVTLGATGVATLGSAVVTAGAAVGTTLTVGTTLGVTGATTLSSTLGVTGTSSFTGAITAGAATFSGAVSCTALASFRASAAVAGASLNIAAGVAPTSPNDGDVWLTTAGLWARVNGATQGPYLSGTLTTSLTLAANSTTLAPLIYVSGSLKTTPAAGGSEYDGRVFYKSYSTTDRAISHNAITFCDPNAYTPVNAAAAVRAFRGLTTGAVTVAAGLYRMRLLIVGSPGGGATIIEASFGGTLAGNGFISGNWQVIDGTQMNASVAVRTALNAFTASDAAPSGAAFGIYFDGELEASGAGTIIPLLKTGSATATINQGCFMELIPIAASSSAIVSIGNWS